ncbi:hypothetical protein BWC65_004607, partial [Salmonella enterica]|nr:hypothetical protein [Salmonella enterica]
MKTSACKASLIFVKKEDSGISCTFNSFNKFSHSIISMPSNILLKVTLAQIQYSAKSEIFVFLTLAQIQYSAKSEIFVF